MITKIILKFLKRSKTFKGGAEDIFSEIFSGNHWKSQESVSGVGSTLEQTEVIRQELPILFEEKKIQTILDLPCGDFNWMKHTNLKNIDYVGGDVVSSIVEKNQEQYSTDQIKFVKLNLIEDILPNVDLILCRDCLVHLPYTDIIRALNNIKKSNIKYMLITSFTSVMTNKDIKMGDWRPINLQKEPFNFPDPITIIVENCTEGGGKYKDKSLLLWKTSEIPTYF